MVEVVVTTMAVIVVVAENTNIMTTIHHNEIGVGPVVTLNSSINSHHVVLRPRVDEGHGVTRTRATTTRSSKTTTTRWGTVSIDRPRGIDPLHAIDPHHDNDNNNITVPGHRQPIDNSNSDRNGMMCLRRSRSWALVVAAAG